MTPHQLHRVATILIWVGRIAGMASMAVIAAFLVGENRGFHFKNWSQLVQFLFFPCGILLGFLLAWWRAGLGAAIVLVSTAGFYVAHALFSGRLPSGPWFLIFASPAIPMLAGAILRSMRPSPTRSQFTG